MGIIRKVGKEMLKAGSLGVAIKTLDVINDKMDEGAKKREEKKRIKEETNKQKILESGRQSEYENSMIIQFSKDALSFQVLNTDGQMEYDAVLEKKSIYLKDFSGTVVANTILERQKKNMTVVGFRYGNNCFGKVETKNEKNYKTIKIMSNDFNLWFNSYDSKYGIEDRFMVTSFQGKLAGNYKIEFNSENDRIMSIILVIAVLQAKYMS